MKVLITGASGLLGRALHRRCLQHHHTVKALAWSRADSDRSLEKLDLTDTDALAACIDHFQPDIILHTAAERRPDVVERDPHASHALNVDVPVNLARIAARQHPTPLLVNISTDYVFDGTKPPYKVDDHPNPLNAYGVSKLQGERAIAENAKPGHYTNLRVPVLYGAADANNESAVNVLLDAILVGPDAAPKKCDAYAVRYPTCVDDIALALVRLADIFAQQPADAKAIPATTHFSAKEAMTKYDMCLVLSRIANAVGFDSRTDHLEPEYEADPLAATARPRHCKLDTSVLEDLGVPIEFTSFEDWWRPYLTEKYQEKLKEEARLAAEAEAKRLREEEEERKRRKAQEAEERRRRQEEEEAAEKRRKEEEEEKEALRIQREKEEAEERRRKQEEEAAAAAAAAAAKAEAEAAEKRRKEEEEEAAAAAAATETTTEGALAQERVQEDDTQEDLQRSQEEMATGPAVAPGESQVAAAETNGQPEDLPAAAAAADTDADACPQPQPVQGELQPRSPPLGSPNPSFSSLMARPTPPATSGLPSPTNSVPPSIHSVHRPGSPPFDPTARHKGEGAGAEPGATPTVSMSALAQDDATVDESAANGNVDTGADINANASSSAAIIDSPLNLEAAAEERRRGGAGSSIGSNAPSRLSSLTDESNLFGGTVRGIDIQGAGRRAPGAGGDGDNDSDGYGQPSPRTSDAVPAFGPGGAAAAAGPVAYGADSMPSFQSDASHSVAASVAASGGSAHPPPTPHAQHGAQAQQPSQQPSQQPLQQQQQQPAATAALGPAADVVDRRSFEAAQLQRERLERQRAARARYDFSIRVGDPQKVGDPMTAHIVYTVRTSTTSPHFRTLQFSVLRRYKDFRWLHAALVQNHPGVIVPPVPEKVALGRFAAELVEARRVGLETCINKIAAHADLQDDEDLRMFLESEQFQVDVKRRDAIKGAVVTPEQKTYKAWGSAVMGVSSAIGSASGSSHRFVETDEWFDAQKVYLDSLEASLKQMCKSVAQVAARRKEVATAMAEMANVAVQLSGSSLSRSVSTCFAAMAEVKRKEWEVEEREAEEDVRKLGTVMYEYERTVGSIRKAFATRIDVWQTWQKSLDDQSKSRARYERVRNDSSPSSSHLASLLAETLEAEHTTLEKKNRFEEVSETCKREMERLDGERVEDFTKAVEVWLQGMLKRQEEVVEEWEAYLRLVGRMGGVGTARGAGGTAGEEVPEPVALADEPQ